MTLQRKTQSHDTNGDSNDAPRPASCVFIELHSPAAFRLVTGRTSATGKVAIIGLFGFADQLRPIWRAAKNDDPYAIWWLIKVEDAISQAMSVVKAQQHAAQERLADYAALGFDPTRRNHRHRVDLLFACPYAYDGARLVQRFDALVLALEAAVYIGALQSAVAATYRRKCERVMRRMFASAQGFQDFGLQRDQVQQRLAVAIDAEEKMGVVPTNVLNGVNRPRLLVETGKNAGGHSNG